jgi:hypothetical protein
VDDAAKIVKGSTATAADGLTSAQKTAGKVNAPRGPPGKPNGGYHNNDLRTATPAEGYSLRHRETNEVLKYGETTQGKKRYSQKFLDRHEADLKFEAKGTKAEMHGWQNQKILEYKAQHDGRRPPLNKSDW